MWNSNCKSGTMGNRYIISHTHTHTRTHTRTHTHTHTHTHIYVVCDRGKKQRDYTFIPTSLFRDCSLIRGFYCLEYSHHRLYTERLFRWMLCRMKGMIVHRESNHPPPTTHHKEHTRRHQQKTAIPFIRQSIFRPSRSSITKSTRRMQILVHPTLRTTHD